MIKKKFLLPSALAVTALTGAIVVPTSLAQPQDTPTESHAPEKPGADEDKDKESVEDTAKKSTAIIARVRATIPQPDKVERLNLDRFRVPDPQPEPEPVIPQETEEVVEDAEMSVPQPEFNVPVTDYGNDVVAAAMSRIGAPYVYGATGPDSFDCSGLVQWSYAQVGKSVPRVSDAQIWGGTPVSLEELQPGDVVGYSGGGHVGIYIGDGQVVHAPTSGQTVTVMGLHDMPVVGASRY